MHVRLNVKFEEQVEKQRRKVKIHDYNENILKFMLAERDYRMTCQLDIVYQGYDQVSMNLFEKYNSVLL